MTRIDPDSLGRITGALLGIRRTDAAGKSNGPTTPASRANGAPRARQLLAALSVRLNGLEPGTTPSDDELLAMIVQESLVLELGSDIAMHPRFGEIVDRVRQALGSASGLEELLGNVRATLGQNAGSHP